MDARARVATSQPRTMWTSGGGDVSSEAPSRGRDVIAREQAESLCVVAHQHLEGRRFEAARSWFHAAERNDATCVSAVVGRAECLWRLARVDEAIDVLRGGLERFLDDSARPDLLALYGRVLWDRNDAESALLVLSEACDLRPDDLKLQQYRDRARVVRAGEQAQRGDLEVALHACGEVPESSPHFPDAVLGAAQICVARQDFQGALEWLSDIPVRAPAERLRDAAVLSCFCHVQLGDGWGTVESTIAALSFDLPDPMVRVFLVDTLSGISAPELVRDAVEFQEEDLPPATQALLCMTLAHLLKNSSTAESLASAHRALDCYERLGAEGAMLEPEAWVFAYEAMQSAGLAGRSDAEILKWALCAEQLLQHWCDEHGFPAHVVHADICAKIGECYFNAGDAREALPLLQRAYAMHAEPGRISYFLSYALAVLGESDEALAILGSGDSCDSDDVEMHRSALIQALQTGSNMRVLYARWLLERDQDEAAEAWFETVQPNEPGAWEAYAQLAKTRLDKNDRNGEREALDIAIAGLRRERPDDHDAAMELVTQLIQVCAALQDVPAELSALQMGMQIAPDRDDWRRRWGCIAPN